VQRLLDIALQAAFRAGGALISLHVSKACLTVIKGYLVDWDAQKAIWDGIFSDQIPNVNTHALRHPFPPAH
jgi:hypothetical protein